MVCRFKELSFFSPLARDVISDYAIPIGMIVFSAVPFIPKFDDSKISVRYQQPSPVLK